MIKDLPELLKENIISQEVADRISEYYFKKKNKKGQNKLFLIFGVLGSLLIGLGIILIIAHNWDSLPRLTKSIFAFIPLVIGQLLCVFTLWKKNGNKVWQESASTFLFFAIGASISLVSQIYHISGELSQFILVWMILSLPILYLLRSSISSMLYLIGITVYACESGYWAYHNSEPYMFWILLLLALPYYVMIVKKTPESAFIQYHNLLIPLTIVIVLETLAKGNSELMTISYLSLFGFIMNLGELSILQKRDIHDKTFTVLGFIGTLVMLFVLSFNTFWNHLAKSNQNIGDLLFTQAMLTVVVTTILAIYLLFKKYRTKEVDGSNPIEFVFLLFIIIYILGSTMPLVAILMVNATILFLGISTIMKGLKSNHLGVLNLGLLIITILIACRFFDTEFSFLTRGLFFVAVGVGFFMTNYRMLKNRRNEN